MTQKPSEAHPTVEWKGDGSLGVYFLKIDGEENFYFKYTNISKQRETVMFFGKESFILRGNFTVEYRNFVNAGIKANRDIQAIFEECHYFYEKNPAFQVKK